MNLRDQIVAAFQDGHDDAIRRLGWWPVWEAVATWWAPRQTCTAREFVPYAKLLGAEDPARVLQALGELAGEWRPHPAAICGHLHRHDTDANVNVGRGRDRFSNTDALAAVTAAIADGEPTCTCAGYHPSRYRHDTNSVLRCRTCAGIEQGQVWAAEDAAALPDHAASAVPNALHAEWEASR